MAPAGRNISEETPERKQVAIQYLSRLFGGLDRLLHTGEFTDLTIICGDQTLKVHKAVLCAQSDFFYAACKHDTFKEGKENVVRLQASALESDEEDASVDDPAAVKLMIDFLYTLDYEVTTKYTPGPEEQGNGAKDAMPLRPTHDDRTLTMHAKIFAAGEKYGIQGLKTLARQRFQHFMDSVPSLKDIAEDIAAAIKVVYTTTPESVVELRNIMGAVLVSARDDIVADATVRAAVESVEGLAYDLFTKTQSLSVVSFWHMNAETTLTMLSRICNNKCTYKGRSDIAKMWQMQLDRF